MSSRLFAEENMPEQVSPIRWRMAAQETGNVGPRAASPTDIPMQMGHAAPLPDLEAQLEQAYQQGLTDGRKQAEAQAMQMANQQVAPVLDSFSRAAREITGAGARIRSENEAAMVQLALAIAKRVVHREMQTDPEAILGLVRSAFDKLTARETHRLRLAPQDAQVMQHRRAELSLPDRLEIVGDAALGPGSAIFETSRGELDASVTTQLDEIQRGLTDLVHRRSHHPG